MPAAAKLPRVYITDFVTDALEPERQVLDGIAEVVAVGAVSESDLAGAVEDAAALIVYHSIQVGPATIERLRQCKLIVRGGVGFDNIQLEAARARGIPVANVPDYGTEEVADSAIGSALAMTRGIMRLQEGLRRGELPWSHQGVQPLFRLRGRTFGIVGLGRIGSAVALRAKALGMDVVFYDPLKADGYDKALGVRRAATLEELLQQSYILSFHCPLTPQTQHMLNARTGALLPRGAYVVNTSRGGVVDTAAVPDLLASGQLAGVALDVLPFEPPQADDPLVQAWKDPQHAAYTRLILNSHAAFYCEEGLQEIRVRTAQACRAAITGEDIRNIVN